jgi:nitrogen regulatory protein P-II 1
VMFHDEKKGSYRGASVSDAAILPRRNIEIVVPNDDADAVVACIKESANTGVVGDGKIYISPVDDSVRISI